MTKFPPDQKNNFKAVVWALLSQTIWLPSLLWSANDWLSSKQIDYDFNSSSETSIQNSKKGVGYGSSEQTVNSLLASTSGAPTNNYTGIVLNTVIPRNSGLKQVHSELSNGTSNLPTVFSVAKRVPFDTSLIAKASVKPNTLLRLDPQITSRSGTDSIRQIFSKADLLGGILTLRDLNDFQMPAIARAERAHWARSGDPLAPIPASWRESMRKALTKLTQHINMTPENRDIGNKQILLDTAKIVHIPSPRVKRATDVPLALQSDGTVDILNQPDDPQIVEEIKHWSTKQALPSEGRMVPAVVHLHPLTEPHIQPTQAKSEVSINNQRQIGASYSSPAIREQSLQVSPNPTPIPEVPTSEPEAPTPVVSAETSVPEAREDRASVESSSQRGAMEPVIIPTSENSEDGVTKP